MPITAFIGVRISWLIVARNELFASLAASAAARASCASWNSRALLQRDADVGGDRAEQPLIVGVVGAFDSRALHADHAERRAGHADGHTEIGARPLADHG